MKDKIPEDALYHLIRCQNMYAMYQNQLDAYSTLRHSVLVPFEKLAGESEWTTFLFQFMCFSSCIGGNQKPVKIVMTLENKYIIFLF